MLSVDGNLLRVLNNTLLNKSITPMNLFKISQKQVENCGNCYDSWLSLGRDETKNLIAWL